MTEVVFEREHESTRLIDVLPDPRAATVEIKPGAMVRIVDVPAALEAVSLPETVSFDLAIEVTDDRCAWNDDTFRVVADAGTTTVEKTDVNPDATIEIGALSQLLVGARSVSRVVRTDRLSVTGSDAADALDSAFTRQDVFLREGF
ncbi:hypothetical protein C440_03708 [Haloferax mucosum ATCC BAA-1512]|uniref:Enhanced intracellular survival protein domain-containing protein n=1 Tax=Haloferax mucosum ATCC BAA-1512 TaxID=662479 RepID=M0IMZ9_9EURY|nr:hypothetical protein C440_03708 [Haloferax mucosum ATCC BAA-1512]